MHIGNQLEPIIKTAHRVRCDIVMTSYEDQVIVIHIQDLTPFILITMDALMPDYNKI